MNRNNDNNNSNQNNTFDVRRQSTPSLQTSNGASVRNNVNKQSAQKYLTNCKSLYSCIHCRAHLANHDELVSRSFQGNHSRAYLFNAVLNVSCGPAVPRELNTGAHAVADIYCSNCKTMIGWKYEKAYVETQKYKEGKFIIELAHCLRENKHLELDKGEQILNRTRRATIKRQRLNSIKSRSSDFSSSHHQQTIPSSSTSTGVPSSAGTSSSSAGSSPNEGYVASGGSGDFAVVEYDADSALNDEFDEDDEELIFPFYDDLCANLLNYPGSMSSSHERRTRRHVYLDSTPYDWKHIESDPAFMRICSPLEQIICPPPSESSSGIASPASSSSSSPPHSISSSGKVSSTAQANSLIQTNLLPTTYQQQQKPGNNDTQFNLEQELPMAADMPGNKEAIEISASKQMLKTSIDNNDQTMGDDGDDKSLDAESTTSKTATENKRISSNSSLSLDEEEFYDCSSDHQVL